MSEQCRFGATPATKRQQQKSQFVDWLAAYWEEARPSVETLLEHQTTTHFLIVWSLFEATHFPRGMETASIRAFADSAGNFDIISASEATTHFHQRYRNREFRRKLRLGSLTEDFSNICRKPRDKLTSQECVFFLLCVAWRYRNNLFHGSKGVAQWEDFEPEIALCVKVIQAFLMAHKAAQLQAS